MIIPVLNASSLLNNVLKALSEQTYPRQLVEIIVVDNGSVDDSPDVAGSFGVKVFYETEKKNPYAARNVGLQHAKGSVIAFVDANKKPGPRWIEKGVGILEREKADLVGGNILFDLGKFPTAAEVYDAITFNDNRKFVLQERGAATGNLFCTRDVVDTIGIFPDEFRSGMDIWWSQEAVKKGFKLVFSEEAVVWCQPRKFMSILKKSWRIGKMFPLICRQKGKSKTYILEQTFRTFAPPKKKILEQKLSQTGVNGSLFKVWWVAWISKIMMGTGRLSGLWKLSRPITPIA